MQGHASPLVRASLLGSEEDLPWGGNKPGGREGSSLSASAAALIKAVVGTGIFAFPSALRESGIVLGSLITLCIGAMSLFVTWYAHSLTHHIPSEWTKPVSPPHLLTLPLQGNDRVCTGLAGGGHECR